MHHASISPDHTAWPAEIAAALAPDIAGMLDHLTDIALYRFLEVTVTATLYEVAAEVVRTAGDGYRMPAYGELERLGRWALPVGYCGSAIPPGTEPRLHLQLPLIAALIMRCRTYAGVDAEDARRWGQDDPGNGDLEQSWQRTTLQDQLTAYAEEAAVFTAA